MQSRLISTGNQGCLTRLTVTAMGQPAAAQHTLMYADSQRLGIALQRGNAAMMARRMEFLSAEVDGIE